MLEPPVSFVPHQSGDEYIYFAYHTRDAVDASAYSTPDGCDPYYHT